MRLTAVGVRSAHYTLRFDANGGVGKMPDEEFSAGVEKRLPLNAFVRAGYAFGGWGLAPDSLAPVYGDGGVVKDVCREDGASAVLYALWMPDVIPDFGESPASLRSTRRWRVRPIPC